MSVEHAASLLATGDPHRLRCVLAAPVATRPKLVALYALNLEIARAAWSSAEPYVGEMRLQWWRDALDELAHGAQPRAHPVLQAASALLSGNVPSVALIDRLIEARRWDLWREPFADASALWAHLDATAGGLVWACARALGAPVNAEAPLRAVALAGGLADWLAACPKLRALGRQPLPPCASTPEGLRALARQGLAHHAAARADRGAVVPVARPALWPHAGAAARLRRVIADPDLILAPASASDPADVAPSLSAAPRSALWAAVLLNHW